MLSCCIFALYYITLTNCDFKYIKHSKYDNYINQYGSGIKNLYEYEVDNKNEQKHHPVASPPLWSKDRWKLKLLSTQYADNFVTDIITQTRLVLHSRLKATTDEFTDSLSWPATDNIKINMKRVSNQYLIPKIDEIFTKAMVYAFNDAKVTYAQESHTDINSVKFYNYAPIKHTIGTGVNNRLPLYRTYGMITRPHLGYNNPIITNYLSTPIQSSASQSAPRLNWRQKVEYRYALKTARVDFEETLQSKEDELKQLMHERMAPIYKMNAYLPATIAPHVEKAVKTFEKHSVEAMDRKARLCFGLVEEAFLTKLDDVEGLKKLKEPKQKAYMEYENRLYNNVYRNRRKRILDYND